MQSVSYNFVSNGYSRGFSRAEINNSVSEADCFIQLHSSATKYTGGYD